MDEWSGSPTTQAPSSSCILRFGYLGLCSSSFAVYLSALVRLRLGHPYPAMAPITDDMVQSLHDTIAKLESRVRQLEGRLGGGEGGSSRAPSSGQSVRMILMGPPGAGEWPMLSS